jgi:hypothetical protein
MIARKKKKKKDKKTRKIDHSTIFKKWVRVGLEKSDRMQNMGRRPK